jgi:penicillin-binding protein-related factor A (putative recombinase)
VSSSKNKSGSLAKANGDRWEREYVRPECRELKRRKEAWVSKNFEADRVPGMQARREPSKPDFSGFIPGGRHVVFEAKACLNETSFYFGQLTDGQREHLHMAHAWGAVAFIYVLETHGEVVDGELQVELERRWLVPWAQVLEIESGGRKSFPFEILDFAKEHGETWLDVWIRLEKAGLT